MQGRYPDFAETLQETRDILAAGVYEKEKGNTFFIEKPAPPEFFNADKPVKSNSSKTFVTTKHFVKADVIDVACFLQDKKNANPAIIVSVDPNDLGGGFLAQSFSQEEELFLRTNALLAFDSMEFSVKSLSLLSKDTKEKLQTFLLCLQRIEKQIGFVLGKGIKTLLLKHIFAGISSYRVPPNGLIYLPSIQLFRASKSRKSTRISPKSNLSFILASSVAKPKWELKGRKYILDPAAEKTLKNNLSLCMEVACSKGHDAGTVF